MFPVSLLLGSQEPGIKRVPNCGDREDKTGITSSQHAAHPDAGDFTSARAVVGLRSAVSGDLPPLPPVSITSLARQYRGRSLCQ